MTETAVKVLEFASNRGDRLQTKRVRLDASGPTYTITLDFLPLADEEAGAWALTMATTAGAVIVSGAFLRDRTDVLSGVVAAGRPAGAIIAYGGPMHEDPRRMAFQEDGYRLLYLPGGYDPETFAISVLPG